jgi:hypothetical protein
MRIMRPSGKAYTKIFSSTLHYGVVMVHTHHCVCYILPGFSKPDICPFDSLAFSDSDFVTTEEDKSEDQQLPRTSRAAALDSIEKENTEADEIIPETSIAENNNNGSIITPEVIRPI